MDEKRERLTVRLSGWFKGRSALEIVFLAVFILGFVHYAGSKHVLHRHESSSCVRLVDGQSHGQTILPTVDSDAHELFPSYTNAVTDFRVTGFRKGETSAFLRAAWSANFLLPNWSVDVFACSGITSNSWTDVGRAAWDFSGNELTVEVPFFLLPESDAASMFFVLGLCFDTDGDGLTDAFEKLVSKTSPFRRDTDGDGLSDGWEVSIGSNPNLAADGNVVDSDADGVADLMERGGIVEDASLPWLAFDGYEDLSSRFPNCASSVAVTTELPVSLAVWGTIVTNVTLTSDGWMFLNRPGYENTGETYGAHDFLQPVDRNVLALSVCGDSSLHARSGMSGRSTLIRLGTATYDGCGFVLVEYLDLYGPISRQQTNSLSFQIAIPTNSATCAYVRFRDVLGDDVDGRAAGIGMQTLGGKGLRSYSYCEEGRIFGGLALRFEFGTNTDPQLTDTDLDGIDDLRELGLGTDPTRSDTDGDGLPDAWEIEMGLDPCSAEGDDGGAGDADRDGLSNIDEYLNDSHPRLRDTDNDRVSDFLEVQRKSNPTDPSDSGIEPPAGTFRDVVFNIDGDYAAWVMTISGLGPDDTRTRRISMGIPGAVQNVPLDVRKGNSYRLSMKWLNSDGHYDRDAPWFCWQAKIDGLPTRMSFDSHSSARLPGNEIVVGDGWIAENASGLLTSHVDQNRGAGAGNVAEQLSATLHVLNPPLISAPEVVGVNDDDDNENGTPDWEEERGSAVDDDLVPVVVSASIPPGLRGMVTVMPNIAMLCGTLWKDLAKTERVDVSDSFTADSSGVASRTYYVEGCGHSSTYRGERIRAQLSCEGMVVSSDHRFTVVQRIAEPISVERIDGKIVNPCCAVVGELTPLKVEVLPLDFPDTQIVWRVVSGSGSFADGGYGRNASFIADGAADTFSTLQVDVGDCPGRSPQFTLRSCVMQEVLVYPCAIYKEDDDSPVSVEYVQALLNEVNVIYRQVGLHFSLGAPIRNIENSKWAELGLVDRSIGAQIRNVMSSTGGVEVYFIPGIPKGVSGRLGKPEPLGNANVYGVVVKNETDAIVLAHEIGHACGLYDIYTLNVENQLSDGEQGLKISFLPDDWSNGTGCRFYSPLLIQSDIIRRMLMHGVRMKEYGQSDIPSGRIWGRAKDHVLGNLSVGRSNMLRFPPRSD